MADTRKLAEQIAPFLKGWRYNRVLTDQLSEHWQSPCILSNGNRRFRIGTSWRDKGRVSVSGEHSRHTITVSPNRAPRAIAGDIERRFLPVYLKDVTEYEKSVQSMADKAEVVRQQTELLRKVCPNLRVGHGHSSEMHFDGGSYRFGYSPDSYSITFNQLTFDESLRLAYFVQSLKEPQ